MGEARRRGRQPAGPLLRQMGDGVSASYSSLPSSPKVILPAPDRAVAFVSLAFIAPLVTMAACCSLSFVRVSPVFMYGSVMRRWACVRR